VIATGGKTEFADIPVAEYGLDQDGLF